MKRMVTLAMMVGFFMVLLTVSPGDVLGQAHKKHVIRDTEIKVMKEISIFALLSDLGIVSFDGTVSGRTVRVGGDVKNTGSITYKGGRTVNLYRVPAASFGRVVLLRSQAIPHLEVNQTWHVPFYLTTDEAPPGTTLELVILGNDADNENNSKKMYVSLVH